MGWGDDDVPPPGTTTQQLFGKGTVNVTVEPLDAPAKALHWINIPPGSQDTPLGAAVGAATFEVVRLVNVDPKLSLVINNSVPEGPLAENKSSSPEADVGVVPWTT